MIEIDKNRKIEELTQKLVDIESVVDYILEKYGARLDMEVIGKLVMIKTIIG